MYAHTYTILPPPLTIPLCVLNTTHIRIQPQATSPLSRTQEAEEGRTTAPTPPVSDDDKSDRGKDGRKDGLSSATRDRSKSRAGRSGAEEQHPAESVQDCAVAVVMLFLLLLLLLLWWCWREWWIMWPIFLCFTCARDGIVTRGTKALDVGFLRGCLPDAMRCRRNRRKKRKRMECKPTLVYHAASSLDQEQPADDAALFVMILFMYVPSVYAQTKRPCTKP